ncbi:MAG: potassium channel family protein [Planctomycetota bacterium]|jgi:hypothetical protein
MKKITVNTKELVINKYVHLLTIIVLSFIAFPLITEKERPFGIPIISLILTFTLLAALRAIVKERKKFRLFFIISVAAFLMDALSEIIFSQNPFIKLLLFSVALLLLSFFLLFSIIELLKHLFYSRVVTVDTILGGISIYFLLGYLWSCMFILIESFNPEAFSTVSRVQLLYFSFSTITTLGYGDITPQNEMAMVLATLEAIVGQMYVTIFIARLVGLHIVSQTKEE